MKKKTTALRLLCIALILMIASAIVIKGVDTDWGNVKVRLGKTVSPNGYMMAYKLYIPKTATSASPAPAMVFMVGGGASLDESSMLAIEAARRGYVVIATDVPGNGQAEPIVNTAGGMDGSKEVVPINSMAEGLNYTAESIEILKSLSCVDKDQLVLAGHSMGGWYVSKTAQTYADEIKACLVLGTFGFSGSLDAATNFNFALIIGQGDESILYRTTGYNTLSDATQNANLKQLFGVEEGKDLEIGKVYGSYEDQTARVLYTPNTMHMLEPDNGTVCTYFLNELTASTVAPKAIDSANHTYWVKDVAMAVFFFMLALMIFALVQLLLNTAMFSSLILKRDDRYIGFKPLSVAWFIAAAILIVLCCAFFVWGYQNYSKYPIVKMLGNAGGKSLWSVVTGILLLIYVVIFHFIQGRKNKATLGDYGLATKDGKGISIVYLLKSILFGAVVFAITYGVFQLYVAYTNCNIHVVLFCNELALLEPTKVAYKFLPICLFMFVFIFMNAIAQKTIAGNSGSFVKEWLLTNAVGTIGFVVLFIVFVVGLCGPSHICLWAANRGCFGAECFLGVAASFWMINAAVYYLNKKTKTVWPGCITAAMLMTWMCIYATGMNF